MKGGEKMVEVVHEHKTHTNSSDDKSTIAGILLILAVILFLYFYLNEGSFTNGSESQILDNPSQLNTGANQQSR